MNYAAEIIASARVKNPIFAPTVADWENSEKELGLELPGDFKELISGVGMGRFGDSLYLRNPLAQNPEDRLDRKSLAIYAEEMAWYREVLEVGYFPEEGGVLPIGSAGASGQLFYQTIPESRRTGKLVVLHLDLYGCTSDERPLAQFLWELHTNVSEPSDKITKSLKFNLWPTGEIKPLFVSRT